VKETRLRHRTCRSAACLVAAAGSGCASPKQGPSCGRPAPRVGGCGPVGERAGSSPPSPGKLSLCCDASEAVESARLRLRRDGREREFGRNDPSVV
jgi:hypothetical protein